MSSVGPINIKSAAPAKGRLVRYWSLLIVVLLAPGVAAQQPATTCAKHCDPRDSVGSELPLRSGPVPVFLYANPVAPDGWGLSTSSSEQTAGIPMEAGQTCLATSWPQQGGGNSFPLLANVTTQGNGEIFAYLRRDSTQALPTNVVLTATVRLVNSEDGALVQELSKADSQPFGAETSNNEQTWEVGLSMPLPSTLRAWQGNAPFGLQILFELCSAAQGIPVGSWAMATSPSPPSRFILLVSDPLQPGGLRVEPRGDEWCVAASYYTPFGSRDLDDETVQLWAVSGVDRTPLTPRLAIIRHADEEPTTLPTTTASGCYATSMFQSATTVEVDAQNRQGTFAVAQTKSTNQDPAVGVPAAPAMAALLGFILASVLSPFRKDKQ